MNLTPTLRKAAILISSLDARSADALLDQMGEVQAQRVRNAVMELGDIDPQEQERIIAEFLGNDAPVASQKDDDSVELSGSLAQAIQTGGASAVPAAAERTAPPFAFLKDAASETVARYLLKEHPQTIAVVLAHLPPPRAAAIVQQFPAPVQADVLLRIGEIDEMNADVVREVERGLEAVLAPELRSARRRGAGAATLQAILNAADKTRPALPTSAARHHPALALVASESPVSTLPAPRRRSEISLEASPAPPVRTEPAPRGPQIEFAQLGQLDDLAWAKILRVADSQVSLLALAGATPELVERLLRQLPPRDARLLERKMETLGPVRLRDIEHAQQQLARIASQLAQQGEIRLPRQRPFATAA